jgi:hypothetical protein
MHHHQNHHYHHHHCHHYHQLLLRYLSLKCLCAQVISNSGLAYKGEVPKMLEEFVEAH